MWFKWDLINLPSVYLHSHIFGIHFFNVRNGLSVPMQSVLLLLLLQPFYGFIPGPPGSVDARRQLLDFMVQGKINRGRHTDHPAGCHSIRTNQCPPPPSHFLQAGCPSFRPTISVKALKATSAFKLGRRCQSSPQRCYLHPLHTLMQWVAGK